MIHFVQRPTGMVLDNFNYARIANEVYRELHYEVWLKVNDIASLIMTAPAPLQTAQQVTEDLAWLPRS